MPTALSFGAFIGKRQFAVDGAGFAFSEVLDTCDVEVPRHLHEDAHFCFILDGHYVTTAKRVAAVCPAATLIFNPAGTEHRDRFHVRGGRFFTVSAAPEIIERVGGHSALDDHARGFDGGPLPWLAARLYREAHAGDPLAPVVMEGMGLELVARVAREAASRARTPPAWLRRATELIADGCVERLSVREIANAVGAHPVHLAREFRRFHHCTPGEMLRAHRIRRAASLLRAPRARIAEVAAATGFADQAQLTKCFKRETGMTPGQYRAVFGFDRGGTSRRSDV